jgi:MazG family protein
MSKYPEFEKLVDVIKALRHPETGCPWDLKQNHQTLIKYLIEESYEFRRAAELDSPKLMEEEIGDVLLQVLLHSQLGSEKQNFDIESVSQKLAEKLVRRHPHVFGENTQEISAEEVTQNWQEIKNAEKGTSKQYYIGDKYLDAPSLKSSEIIGERTATCNFDWEDYGQVLYKVEEEWQELKEELGVVGTGYNSDRVEEEMGDLLFSMAQLARHLKLDPEETLRKANKKFLKRFQQIEDHLDNENLAVTDVTQERLEELWNHVKKN